MFANRHNIRRILLDSSEYTEVVSEQKAAIAIDFHANSSSIFWTDVVKETIYRAGLNNESSVEAIVTDGLHTPDGLAVDWINTKLYWTDTGTELIEVSDFDGQNRLQLIASDLDEPRAIVVAPAIGYVVIHGGCITHFNMLFLMMGLISLVEKIKLMLISTCHFHIRSLE